MGGKQADDLSHITHFKLLSLLQSSQVRFARGIIRRLVFDVIYLAWLS